MLIRSGAMKMPAHWCGSPAGTHLANYANNLQRPCLVRCLGAFQGGSTKKSLTARDFLVREKTRVYTSSLVTDEHVQCPSAFVQPAH